MKSESVVQGVQNAPHRALFNALGFTREEMSRPLVGIVKMCIRDSAGTEEKNNPLKAPVLRVPDFNHPFADSLYHTVPSFPNFGFLFSMAGFLTNIQAVILFLWRSLWKTR